MTTNMKERTLIRIVDDDAGVRDSYRFLLEGEGWHVVEYPSAEEFLIKDNYRIPGCILLDIRMPGMSGLQLQAHLQSLKTDLPIIFITAHGTIEDAVKTIKKGACDFLTKPVKDEVLIETIESAIGTFLQEQQAKELSRSEAGRLKLLTDREMEVALGLSEGKLNKIIAADLGISERTVQVHRASILRKLEIRSTAELATILVHAGLK